MHVLVMGHRKGLVKALQKKGISYSLVVKAPGKLSKKAIEFFEVEDFPQTQKGVEKLALEISKSSISPTHIIASIEGAVYPASLLRKILNCRISKHSVARRCSNKSEMKIHLSKLGIPMSKFLVGEKNLSIDTLTDKLNFPVVVKDIKNSGSRGIVFVNNKEELKPLLSKDRIYESFVKGSEGSIESFVNNKEILFSNITEYYIKKFSNVLPAKYDETTTKAISDLNKTVIEKLNINWGMTHMEYYLTKDGLLFGEIALRPPGGYIMELMELAYGFDPWEALICCELDLPFSFAHKELKHSACLIYHPGEGVVTEVKDLAAKTLVKDKIKINVGDEVSHRIGVGQDIGHSLFQSESIVSLKDDIDKCHLLNRIVL